MAESQKEDTGSTTVIPTYDLTGKKVARIYEFKRTKHGPMLRENRDNHVQLLTESLKSLEFEVEVLEDLDDEGLKQDLENIAKGTEELACLWVFIMATCNEDFFRCSKGSVRLNDLWKTFTGEKCKILFGKPKMFFIQMDVESKRDSFTVLMNKLPPKCEVKKTVLTLPESSDIMLAEFRRTEQDKDFSVGRFLSEELEKPEPRNINTIMASIAGRSWNETPRFSSTFCKQLYLPLQAQTSGSALQTIDGTSIERYDMPGKRMAYSFIFREFQNLDDLPGGKADKLAVEDAMESRGFIYEDCNKGWRLTKDGLKEKMAEIAKNTENADCVMVFISTHGDSEDKLYAYDGHFLMHDLWLPFKENDGYQGKPKIFIIDVCRGKGVEKRAEKIIYSARENVQEEETASIEPSSVTDIKVPKGGTVEAESPLKTLAQEEETGISPMDVDPDESCVEDSLQIEKREKTQENSDLIIGLSTVDNMIAVQSDNGSPYVQCLCQKLKQRDGCGIFDLLVYGNCKVASSIEAVIQKMKCRQMPVFSSSLRKDIYL